MQIEKQQLFNVWYFEDVRFHVEFKHLLVKTEPLAGHKDILMLAVYSESFHQINFIISNKAGPSQIYIIRY